KRIDDDDFMIRFSQRSPRSIWSDVNERLARSLVKDGRMKPAGLRAFQARRKEAPAYAYEQRRGLSAAFEKRLRADPAAAKTWASFPPGYRRTVGFWV